MDDLGVVAGRNGERPSYDELAVVVVGLTARLDELDLAILVDGPVDVAPDAVDLHVGLVDEPPVARRVAANRAVSASSGVYRWTHRYTVTWSTWMPRSASRSSTSR
jgi:hypothetical protein